MGNEIKTTTDAERLVELPVTCETTTKIMALCPYCNGVKASACADTKEERNESLRYAKAWVKRGDVVVERKHKRGDPMPRWCAGECR